jgi:hypothetical protein
MLAGSQVEAKLLDAQKTRDFAITPLELSNHNLDSLLRERLASSRTDPI